MIFRIELHPSALKELDDSYKWYQARSEGLGVRFITFVNKRLTDIADHPERYAKKKDSFREATVDVFPFIIIYEVLKKEKVIFVSYIFHAKRNPRLKYKR
jgi:mRNA-degrading endonuclease RelE of RelBE toxin-antitoxin system